MNKQALWGLLASQMPETFVGENTGSNDLREGGRQAHRVSHEAGWPSPNLGKEETSGSLHRCRDIRAMAKLLC